MKKVCTCVTACKIHVSIFYFSSCESNEVDKTMNEPEIITEDGRY